MITKDKIVKKPRQELHLKTMELETPITDPNSDDIEAFLDNCHGKYAGTYRFCILERANKSAYIQTAYDFDENEQLDRWRLECRIYKEDGTYQHLYATTRDYLSRRTELIYSLTVIKRAFLHFYMNLSTGPLLPGLDWYEEDLDYLDKTNDGTKCAAVDKSIPETRQLSSDEYYRKSCHPRLRYNPYKRFALLWRAARAGHRKAQYILAMSYERGSGCTKNIQKAEFWYRKAADNGSSLAQYRLGESYYYGRLTERNPTDAIKYMKMAVDAGNKDALNALAYMCFHQKTYLGDFNLEDLLKKSISDRHELALLNLGEYYYRGYWNIPPDYDKAFECFSEAANSRFDYVRHIAGNFLAFMYYDGKGVEKNTVDSMVFWQQQDNSKWETPNFAPDIMQLLAERQSLSISKARTGNAESQHELATFYELGLIGFEKQYEKAVYWYEKAAEQGAAYAMNSLAHFYDKGKGGKEKDTYKAISLYLEAVRQNEASAMMNLAAKFRKNKKLENPAIARALYEAGLEEIPYAKKYLKDLKKEISKKQRKKVFGKSAMPLKKAILKIEKIIAKKLAR